MHCLFAVAIGFAWTVSTSILLVFGTGDSNDTAVICLFGLLILTLKRFTGALAA